MPVILGFNYEAHNALTYKFNTPATSVKPRCTHVSNFSNIWQSAADLFYAGPQ